MYIEILKEDKEMAGEPYAAKAIYIYGSGEPMYKNCLFWLIDNYVVIAKNPAKDPATEWYAKSEVWKMEGVRPVESKITYTCEK